MNATPQKSYLEKLREKREGLMALPAVTPEQQADLELAKKLQLEMVALQSAIGGTSLLPRRPKGLREAKRAELVEKAKAKQKELDDVMRRISFIK